MAGSTTTIVQAVASLLRSGVTPPLNAVYDYRPTRDPQGNETPAAWVWVSRQQEFRHTFGQTQGAKWVNHTVHVDVRWFSHKPADATYGQPAWQDLLDAIRARLRANQTLPTASGVTVLRFGEDIDVMNDEPVADGNATVDYHARITSVVLEEVQPA
jgi:hypothetical protein